MAKFWKALFGTPEIDPDPEELYDWMRRPRLEGARLTCERLAAELLRAKTDLYLQARRENASYFGADESSELEAVRQNRNSAQQTVNDFLNDSLREFPWLATTLLLEGGRLETCFRKLKHPGQRPDICKGEGAHHAHPLKDDRGWICCRCGEIRGILPGYDSPGTGAEPARDPASRSHHEPNKEGKS
jgi:hypothetical protein